MKKLMVLLLVLFLVLSLVACGGNGGGGRTSGRTEFTLGETFEFDGLEITFSEVISFARVQDRISDHHRAYAFYIPTTVVNVGEASNRLSEWIFTIFSPDGRSVNPLNWEFEDTSILNQGDILPGAEKSGNLYILYVEDGEYVIEFSDFETTLTVRFEMEFDFGAVPEVQTEFSLGDTITISDLDLHFGETISWGRIDSRWSERDGELYFYLTVTMQNNSDSAAGFPWSFQTFGPDGHELDRIAWEVENDDITGAGDVLPGVTLSGYWHLQYAGDGEYVIEFDDRFGSGEVLRLNFFVDSDDIPPALAGDPEEAEATGEQAEIAGIWQKDGDDFVLYTFNPIGGFLRAGPEVGFEGGYWSMDNGELHIELITGETERWSVQIADDVLTLTNADDATVLTFTRS
ncbi:MAG: DUF4352 domain-containing protein [Oscillospiraceae bacterium]|nr:DUF4352 domain-containing protein [Oscillospiraceae bacterium]